MQSLFYFKFFFYVFFCFVFRYILKLNYILFPRASEIIRTFHCYAYQALQKLFFDIVKRLSLKILLISLKLCLSGST